MTTSATVPPVESVAPGLKTHVEPGGLAGAQKGLLGVGLIALGASLIPWFGGEEAKHQFYFSYLVSYLFVLSIVLGSMFFVLVQHLSRAGWSVVVRRVAENVMGTMPFMAVLFLPIVIGYQDIYHHWVHASHINPGEPGFDPVLYHKRGYLNETFFLIRIGLFFAIWIGIATFFRKTSLKQDESGDPALTLRMARVAAPCMVLFALSVTFAAIDWMMSLDPHWFSTMWGVYFFAGCFLSAMALMALTLMWFRGKGLLSDAVTTEHFHDVGKFIFAFVVFWTYAAFSQYMLIWYANIPEETWWYHHHLEGNWGSIGEFLMIGHFFIPFAFLMSRHVKRARATLAIGAVFLLVMHWIDLHWIVMPSLHHHGMHLSWVDFSSLIGLFAIMFGLFLGNMRKAPILPVRDPRLAESLKFTNF